jgi:hypothetical protein
VIHKICPRSLLEKLPNISHVIYMEDPLQQRGKSSGFRPDVKILPFETVLSEVQFDKDFLR